MAIKLIAVDLDGTFLHDDKRFNERLFAEVVDKMRAKDVRFVVATGNNPVRVANFFKNFPNDYDLIGNNGAQIVIDQRPLRATTLSNDIIQQVDELVLANESPTNGVYRGLIYTGMAQSFMPARHADAKQSFAELKPHFPALTLYDDVANIDDSANIVQASVHWTNGDDAFMALAKNAFDKRAHVTTSGYGAVDIVPTGVNKAAGLAMFADHFGIAPSEMAAFGDGFNDLEMLDYVGLPFAMPNGEPALYQRFNHALDTNENDGVLRTILSLL